MLGWLCRTGTWRSPTRPEDSHHQPEWLYGASAAVPPLPPTALRCCLPRPGTGAVCGDPPTWLSLPWTPLHQGLSTRVPAGCALPRAGWQLGEAAGAPAVLGSQFCSNELLEAY